MKHLLALLLSSLLFLGIYTFKLEPFHTFSLHFNDLNFKFQNKEASKDIVFIAIDEKSVNHFGRWPWNRDVLAKAISHVDSSALLIFDMVFSESTPHDEKLASALREQDNNICGFFLRQKASHSISPTQAELLSDSSLERLSSSLENTMMFIEGSEVEVNIEQILSTCTLSATFSTLRDSDQFLRKYPLAFIYNEELYPSIGTQALRMYKNRDLLHVKDSTFSLDTHKIYSDERGFSLLNYYPLKSYQSYSFYDLYTNNLPKDLLKDKIVILGITEIGVGDIRATPIGLIPGPLVHYTFISNVLNDELLHVNTTLNYLSLLFFLLLALIGLRINSIYKRISIYVLSYLFFLVASKLLYLYSNLYIDAFYPFLALILSAISSESILYAEQEKQSQFIEDAFSSYLSPILLKKLMQEPEKLKLGGEKKELTIFFSDIRSFTSISEKMPPQKLTEYLNRYFTPMSNIVTKHNGMIDKYIGDALMAFYNAPLDVSEHAKVACIASLEMIKELDILNATFVKEGLAPINIGIGLNTAEVVVGNMGSFKRFNYTVIGDGVNLASRVEGLNKEFNTQIIITEFTKAQIGDEFLTRALDKVKVKGKEEVVMLYELLDDNEENRVKVEKFSHALLLYQNQEHDKALTLFNNLVQDDKVCEYFIKQINS